MVKEPDQLLKRLRQLGEPRFRGMLRDRRLDRDGQLSSRDQVLRVRRWLPQSGPEWAELAWKGLTTVSPGGYKQREEIETRQGDGQATLRLLEALGFTVVEAIDRFVEVYHIGDADLRLEWYPRMDVLLEIEGSAAAIEAVIATLRLPRQACRPVPLRTFAAEFTARAGRPAVLAEALLGGEPPTWSGA